MFETLVGGVSCTKSLQMMTKVNMLLQYELSSTQMKQAGVACLWCFSLAREQSIWCRVSKPDLH